MKSNPRLYPSFSKFKSSSRAASKVGRGNRSKHTAPELFLRTAIHKLGGRYRLEYPNVPGRPDLVFVRTRVAVFCDGDFWHGRRWAWRRQKLESGMNANYWTAKIERNRLRDKETNRRLKALGWLPVRVWEGEIKRNPNQVAKKIIATIEARQKHL